MGQDWLLGWLLPMVVGVAMGALATTMGTQKLVEPAVEPQPEPEEALNCPPCKWFGGLRDFLWAYKYSRWDARRGFSWCDLFAGSMTEAAFATGLRATSSP